MSYRTWSLQLTADQMNWMYVGDEISEGSCWWEEEGLVRCWGENCTQKTPIETWRQQQTNDKRYAKKLNGRFPFNQNFRKIGYSDKWYRNIPEFHCWISEMRTLQPKILEIPGAKWNGKKTPGKKFSKILVYFATLTSLMEILENAFPFATRSCRNFKADVLVEWKAPNE